jgi:hypothetical protein
LHRKIAVTSGKTKDEADRKLLDIRMLHVQGPGTMCRYGSEVLDAWLRDDVKPTVAPRTYDNYALNVRRLQPHIGTIRLDALKPDHIKAAYRALTEQDCRREACSRCTERCVPHSDKRFAPNIYSVIQPSVYRRRARERDDALTPEQVRTMLTVSQADRLYAIWWCSPRPACDWERRQGFSGKTLTSTGES